MHCKYRVYLETQVILGICSLLLSYLESNLKQSPWVSINGIKTDGALGRIHDQMTISGGPFLLPPLRSSVGCAEFATFFICFAANLSEYRSYSLHIRKHHLFASFASYSLRNIRTNSYKNFRFDTKQMHVEVDIRFRANIRYTLSHAGEYSPQNILPVYNTPMFICRQLLRFLALFMQTSNTTNC